VLTWRQLGLHDKPIILLNIDGFCDPLSALIDNCIAEGFAEHSLADYVTVAPSVPDMTRALRAALS